MAYGSQAVWWWHGTLSGGAYVDMKTHGGSIEFNDPKPAKQAPELKGEHARYRLDRESDGASRGALPHDAIYLSVFRSKRLRSWLFLSPRTPEFRHNYEVSTTSEKEAAVPE